MNYIDRHLNEAWFRILDQVAGAMGCTTDDCERQDGEKPCVDCMLAAERAVEAYEKARA